MFGIPSQTPFDLRFWLFGVHVRVHPMHWVVSAFLGWGWYNGGGLDLLNLPFWLFAVFVSVLTHEMGHVLVGRFFGSNGNILLWSFGGLAVGASDLRQRWQRILVSLAGPGIQFILLGVVIPIGFLLLPCAQLKWQQILEQLGIVHIGLVQERVSIPMWQDLLGNLWVMLMIINALWPVFNLLPIWPLDGGRVTREVLEGSFRYSHMGVVVSLWISTGVAGLLAVFVLYNTYYYDGRHELIPYVSRHFRGLWNGLFFAMFAVSSFQALQVERSRGSRWNDELPWER